ncbi:hypothetical protein ACFW4O_36210 [Streptomyces mutabilis]|uniref:hypothetical protein n=1 Tax=Streptomyces mutabilis TaxID=67332 RepID=UPI0036A17967
MREVLSWLPVLLAISVSSPRWQGPTRVCELAFHGVAALAHRGVGRLFLQRGRVRRGGETTSYGAGTSATRG